MPTSPATVWRCAARRNFNALTLFTFLYLAWSSYGLYRARNSTDPAALEKHSLFSAMPAQSADASNAMGSTTASLTETLVIGERSNGSSSSAPPPAAAKPKKRGTGGFNPFFARPEDGDVPSLAPCSGFSAAAGVASWAANNRETVAAGASWAANNADTVVAGARWAADNRETVAAGASFVANNADTVAAAGAAVSASGGSGAAVNPFCGNGHLRGV